MKSSSSLLPDAKWRSFQLGFAKAYSPSATQSFARAWEQLLGLWGKRSLKPQINECAVSSCAQQRGPNSVVGFAEGFRDEKCINVKERLERKNELFSCVRVVSVWAQQWSTHGMSQSGPHTTNDPLPLVSTCGTPLRSTLTAP